MMDCRTLHVMDLCDTLRSNCSPCEEANLEDSLDGKRSEESRN